MPNHRNIPHSLEPYLRLPRELSLVLLTSTLGCSASWLTARFIGASLSQSDIEGDQIEDDQTCVILVSWMRDSVFWKAEIKRATGLDFGRLASTNRLFHIDTFTESKSTSEILESISLTIRNIRQHNEDSNGTKSKILMVLDNPDVCLATASTTAAELNKFLMSVRRQVWSTVLSCYAGLPLVTAATVGPEVKSTPIEVESAAFITTQAHAAEMVISVRELDTGAAKDVSGVLRVTRGGDVYGVADEENDRVDEVEMLYLVQKDGNVKAFARGSEVES